MRTLRTVGHVAGALALAVALVGCGGDDGDTDVTDDAGSIASDTDDASEDADDAANADASEDSAGDDDAADDSAGAEDVADDNGDADDSDGDDESAAAGIYRDYSDDAVADTSYDTTVVFFYASWCPECRAFEQAIEAEGVPDGVQILKTDYDTEHDLRERYGITIQTTFVEVDADGNEVSKWIGYGEDKSVDAILDNLG